MKYRWFFLLSLVVANSAFSESVASWTKRYVHAVPDGQRNWWPASLEKHHLEAAIRNEKEITVCGETWNIQEGRDEDTERDAAIIDNVLSVVRESQETDLVLSFTGNNHFFDIWIASLMETGLPEMGFSSVEYPLDPQSGNDSYRRLLSRFSYDTSAGYPYPVPVYFLSSLSWASWKNRLSLSADELMAKLDQRELVTLPRVVHFGDIHTLDSTRVFDEFPLEEYLEQTGLKRVVLALEGMPFGQTKTPEQAFEDQDTWDSMKFQYERSDGFERMKRQISGRQGEARRKAILGYNSAVSLARAARSQPRVLAFLRRLRDSDRPEGSIVIRGVDQGRLHDPCEAVLQMKGRGAKPIPFHRDANVKTKKRKKRK